MEENNEEYITIDEEVITNLKRSILLYVVILIVCVIVPLFITILTSHTLTNFNIFISFIGITLICGDQIIKIGQVLLAYWGAEFEDEDFNG